MYYYYISKWFLEKSDPITGPNFTKPHKLVFNEMLAAPFYDRCVVKPKAFGKLKKSCCV